MQIDIELVGMLLSLAGSIYATTYSSIKQHKNSKEILKLQQQYESDEKKSDNYENHSQKAITNYLQSAGSFLFDSSSKDFISDFGKSVSEIFMYIPKSKRESVRELNSLIQQIHSTHVRYGDNSYAVREKYVNDAISLYYQLCEDFADLGVKPPSTSEKN